VEHVRPEEDVGAHVALGGVLVFECAHTLLGAEVLLIYTLLLLCVFREEFVAVPAGNLFRECHYTHLFHRGVYFIAHGLECLLELTSVFFFVEFAIQESIILAVFQEDNTFSV